MEYKHQHFNPKLLNINDVLESISSEWRFEQVVPVTDYDWIAVFSKQETNLVSEK